MITRITRITRITCKLLQGSREDIPSGNHCRAAGGGKIFTYFHKVEEQHLILYILYLFQSITKTTKFALHPFCLSRRFPDRSSFLCLLGKMSLSHLGRDSFSWCRPIQNIQPSSTPTNLLPHHHHQHHCDLSPPSPPPFLLSN